MKNNRPLIIRNATVKDPGSDFQGQAGTDVYITEGRIAAIGSQMIMPDDAEELDAGGMYLSPGLFDMQISCGEPGFEEKETFGSLSGAALAGGVTDMLVMPATRPVSDNRGQIEYLRKITAALPARMHFAAALSVGMKGIDLAELYDMHQGGALAFTDDKSPVDNSVLLHLALQYVKISGGLLMMHNEDSALRMGGKVNEGEIATRLGMKGAPAISEELGLIRNIALARYHHSALHLSGISTRNAVQLVREAKKSGVQVTCSVYAHHLYFTDIQLETFSSDFKVWPPLRSESDRQALMEGLMDGTVDVVCSDHRPENPENKDVEFDFAAYGMCGLETFFGAAAFALGEQNDDLLLEKAAYAPRRILGLEPPSVRVGSEARLFLWHPGNYTFEKSMIRSKSANTPFPGKTLRGRIAGTYSPEGGWKPN